MLNYLINLLTGPDASVCQCHTMRLFLPGEQDVAGWKTTSFGFEPEMLFGSLETVRICTNVNKLLGSWLTHKFHQTYSFFVLQF